MTEIGTLPPHLAARLSRMLWTARESAQQLADLVEARVHRADRHNRRLVAEIDAFRAEQGWPADGFGGEAEGSVGDGDHTFRELYAHRVTLFALVCRLRPDVAWRSYRHHDGSMFDGWFIAGLQPPTGQVTYHAPLSAWDEFEGVATLDRAPEWDGHDADQARARLASWWPDNAGMRSRVEVEARRRECNDRLVQAWTQATDPVAATVAEAARMHELDWVLGRNQG